MDNLQREAERLYNEVKQYCGTNNTSTTRKLVSMSRRLYDDFRGLINPRTLEAEATAIKEFLYHGMKGGEMQEVHCNELKNSYEHLRLALRKFE